MSDIKKGYKKTKVGVIPEDWESVKLGRIGEFYKGKGISKKDLSDEGLPALRYADIYTEHNNYIKNFKSFITESYKENTVLLKKGSIVFAGSGETPEDIGKSVAYLDDQDAYVGGDTIVMEPKNQDSMFLGFMLNGNAIRRQLFAKAQGNSVVHVYKSNIQNIIIPLPPLSEQKKIAEILSKWHEAIEKQQELIKEKKKLKKGLMQQLLTGKKRFKEFLPADRHGVKSEKFKDTKIGKVPEDWEVVKIKNIAREVKEYNRDGNEIRVLSSTKYDGLVDSLKYFNRKVFSDDTSGYKLVKNGQFAYGTNHIEEGPIGLLEEYEVGLVSPMYTVFAVDSTKVNPRLLFKVLKSDRLIYTYQVRTKGTVNRRGSLRWKDFKEIHLALPKTEEQNKIQTAISKSEDEIRLLEEVLAQLKEQKKGLMQKLLTGEIRVNY